MSLAAALKEATLDAHRRAESRALQRGLIRATVDEPRLLAYLAQLHLLHALLERRLDEHRDVARLIGWSDDARHSLRLRTDLAALAADADDLPLMPSTKRLQARIDAAIEDEPATLLGFFYVLEGSMNGNRFIVRALRGSRAAGRCSFSYFDPYGDEQPLRWAAFKTSLDQARLDPRRERLVIDAALHMFDGISEISDEVMASEGVVASVPAE